MAEKINIRKVCAFYLSQLSHGNQVIHPNGRQELAEELLCAYELLSTHGLIDMEESPQGGDEDDNPENNDLIVCITEEGKKTIEKNQPMLEKELSNFNPDTAEESMINKIISLKQ